MAIEKSKGVTPTEQYLAELCDRTFLKVWCYANPFKSDRKELCDLIAAFENHIFLFFDRESRKFDNAADIELTWERWQREAVQKQIVTANGAARYVFQHPDEVYLDGKCAVKLPITIPTVNAVVHKIIVAHGATEACKEFSSSNVTGSLGICYGDEPNGSFFPFMIRLDKSQTVHVFDSYNLDIILQELDTFHDFTRYIVEKERAVSELDVLMYCGEEDLLAHYFANFDKSENKNVIGVEDKSANLVAIGEGEWKGFVESDAYKRRKSANETSYLWDDLIQRTGQNALSGALLGTGNVFTQQSAIYEMAKEPRMHRRALSDALISAIKSFPSAADKLMRKISFLPSYFSGTAYVFLQVWKPNVVDYDGEYRPTRQAMLEIACGVAKNKFPNFTKIIGIAIDAPKHSTTNSEDFILMDCSEWSEETRERYEKANEGLRFFETSAMRATHFRVQEFPDAPPRPPSASVPPRRKIGRNERCYCGSGKKYKKCCGS